MNRNASSPVGRNTNGNADRGIHKKAGNGANTTASAVVAPDELNKEDLKLTAGAQTASGDWHDDPPPGKTEAFRPFSKRMVGPLGAYRVSLIIVALVTMGTVVLTVAAPKVLGQATNVIFEGMASTMLPAGTTKAQAIETLRARGMDDFATVLSTMGVVPGADIDYTRLSWVLTVVLDLYVGPDLLNWLQGWLIDRITIKTLYRLRAQVEDKVHRLPLSYFGTIQRSELLSRLTNDVNNVTNTLQQSLFGILMATFAVMGVLGMMFSISWKLALVALIAFPLMGVTFGIIGPRSQKAFTHQWTRTGRINTRAEESFSRRALTQIYGRTASVCEASAAENEELFRASLRAQFLSGIMMPIMLVIGNINYVAIAVVGGTMVASGSLHLGDVQAFIQYSQQFSQPLGQLDGMAAVVWSRTASTERIFELLDAEEERPDDVAPGNAGTGPSATAVSPKGPTGPSVIEMEHVRFSYSPEVELIRDPLLRVDPGHTVVIMEPTGAGKTTLVSLLMCFCKLDKGRILIGGRDVATIVRHNVRRRTGMILQDPWLFADTICENIRYGRPEASDGEVKATAGACFVDHIIKALPQGYDAVLEEDTVNISADERQLPAITRAFVANPAVLILDEATGSVGIRTELLVQQAMNMLRESHTDFIITHYLFTIRDADTILIMEHSGIVKQDSHDELITTGGAYARLHAAQFASGAAVAIGD